MILTNFYLSASCRGIPFGSYPALVATVRASEIAVRKTDLPYIKSASDFTLLLINNLLKYQLGALLTNHPLSAQTAGPNSFDP